MTRAPVRTNDKTRALRCWLLTAVVALMCALGTRASESLTLYQKLNTPRLMRMADSLAAEDRPQAMLLYEAVATRYHRGDGPEAARMARRANVRLWLYHIQEAVNYERDLLVLERIDSIDSEMGWRSGLTQLGRAIVCQDMYALTGDTALLRRSGTLLRRSLADAALAGNDWVADRAFGNLLIVGFDLPQVGIEREFSLYVKMKGDGYLRPLNLALGRMTHRRGRERIAEVDSLIATLPPTDGRSIYYALCTQATEYTRMGMPEQAVATLRRFTELCAPGEDKKDLRMDRYMRLSRLYDAMGDHATANEMYRRYGTLKDSVLSYQQVASMGSMELSRKMRQVSQEMNELRWHNRLRAIIIWCAVALIAAAAVFGWMFYRKASRLSQTLASLYERVKPARTPRRPQPESPAPAPVSEDDADLLERMNRVRDTSDEVLSPDFNAQRFAELVGESYLRISKVINDACGCNFPSYIAQRRIAEAQRRIETMPDFRRLTVDAMAQSVGMKSRSTFGKYFMLHTGLKPSEYVRQVERGANV